MANHIELRRVIYNEESVTGAITEWEGWEYRTKDVTASLLGLIPLSSSWSAWTPIETTTVYKDENGNII